jgi:hypothetical protein
MAGSVSMYKRLSRSFDSFLIFQVFNFKKLISIKMKAIKILIAGLLFAMLLPVNLHSQGCAPVKSDDGVNIFGFLQPQFETKFVKDGPQNSFTFNRARIGVTGNIPYDILYYAVVETGPFFNNGNAFLLDAFISYQRYPFAKIAVGKFKSPFTLEMSTPCQGLNTIYRSDIVRNLVSPDRDYGIMISGDIKDKLISYAFAVTNGTGLGFFDNNNGKTLHSRIQLMPKEFVKIGGGAQYGTHPSAVVDAVEEDSRFRWAADIQLNHKGFDLIGEYLGGNDKGSSVVGGGCGGAPVIVEGDTKRSGYYVTGMYKTKWNLQPLVRYENYNTDVTTKNREEHTLVFGLNYWLNDWTRIQMNYLYKSEDRIEVKNDEFIIQFQVTF